MKCVLSYSGLVVGSNGKDYLLSEIIERYNNFYTDGEKKVEYDKEDGIFRIKIGYSNNYEIILSDKQKAAFEGKTMDPSIKELQKFLLDYEKGEIVKQVREDIQNSAYPTDSKTYNVYAESLNKDLLNTGAELVKNGIRATWPFLIIGITIPMWLTPATNDWSVVAQVLGMLALLGVDVAGVIGIIKRSLDRFMFDEPSETYEQVLESLKELKKVLMKKRDLKEHKKEVEEELKKENFSDFIQREDDKDNAKVKEYKDQFLNEFNAVVTDLNKLPDEKQRKYRERLSSLLTDYQNRVNSLLEKSEGEMVLGEAEDVWQIFVELLPELNAISFDLAKELKAVNEREEFNAEVKEIQQALSGGYTDGYTDGYSDDLENGGVAYQRKG